MTSLALLLLRLVSGTILVGHGYTKLFGGRGAAPPEALKRVFGPGFPAAVERSGPKGFAETLEKMDVPAPRIAAYVSGLSEFGGGLALLLGFHTKLAAPVVMANLATAIQRVHWKKGLYGAEGFEFPLMLEAAAATVLLAGPGNLSLDALTHRPPRRDRHPQGKAA